MAKSAALRSFNGASAGFNFSVFYVSSLAVYVLLLSFGAGTRLVARPYGDCMAGHWSLCTAAYSSKADQRQLCPPISGQKWAFTGFIPALSAFDESTFAGVIYLIGASFWAVEATYTLWCLKDVFLFFRSAGSGPQPDQHTTDLQAFKHQTSPR
eukprot:gene30869-35913_t